MPLEHNAPVVALFAVRYSVRVAPGPVRHPHAHVGPVHRVRVVDLHRRVPQRRCLQTLLDFRPLLSCDKSLGSYRRDPVFGDADATGILLQDLAQTTDVVHVQLPPVVAPPTEKRPDQVPHVAPAVTGGRGTRGSRGPLADVSIAGRFRLIFRRGGRGRSSGEARDPRRGGEDVGRVLRVHRAPATTLDVLFLVFGDQVVAGKGGKLVRIEVEIRERVGPVRLESGVELLRPLEVVGNAPVCGEVLGVRHAAATRSRVAHEFQNRFLHLRLHEAEMEDSELDYRCRKNPQR
mmetsp:Transcript_22201/g.55958  ORF Transcript_22201/g.55958 Transcript_22201/m.55958 type:complete len:291 (+) Transcript_22201:1445-2317(+)